MDIPLNEKKYRILTEMGGFQLCFIYFELFIFC